MMFLDNMGGYLLIALFLYLCYCDYKKHKEAKRHRKD